MIMKTFFVALMALFVAGAMLVPEPADAKRFGGGRSLGKQYSAPQRAEAPRQNQQSQQQGTQSANANAARATPARSGASRWLGPLAGLAAGGLLASLFFGDAFDGFQFMDFLLIALLIFGGFMLFKMLRNRQAGAGPVPAAAYGRGSVSAPPTPPMPPMSRPGSGAQGAASNPMAGAPAADQAPAWFDGAGFVEGAKTHFIRLQAAWDRSDFRDIREYTSPELYAEVKREREALGSAPNDTEVVTLNAELLWVRRDHDRAVASVRFTGLVREERSAAANPLDEIWHVAHDWASAEGTWTIIGIQQAGG
jgi:predicted lipid-binding transport protein (Tim44 family)